MSLRRIAWAAGAAFLVALFAPAASTGASLVVLPLENASGSEQAARKLAPIVAAGLQAKGWDVIAGDRVEAFLEENRIRYLDSLETPLREKLLASLGAEGVLLGTVFTYQGPSDATVALGARMVLVGGKIAWGDAAAVSVADTERMLGLASISTIDEISRAAVDRLLRRLPQPGRDAGELPGPSKPFLRKGPTTYRSAELPTGEIHRICILPFDNKTGAQQAAPIVNSILTIRLLGTRSFDVVEPAELRAAIQAESIRSFTGIPPDRLLALGKRLGSTLFLSGAIYKYFDPPTRSTRMPPAMQLDVMLTDIERGHIVWSAGHERQGNDYQGLFMRGAATCAAALADHVISEIVQAEENAKPSPAPSPAPASKKKGVVTQ